ncbi:MAG: hypothetical protein II200_05495 [Bacteroidaceae bacterium]|nr:hypothetical protein [Bacteroidaceae bacterium]
MMLLALLMFSLPAMAQLTEEVRSESVFYFKNFKKAKIIQPFGRFVEVEANVFLKDASLCFIENDTVKKAFLDKVIAVQFDSVEFRTIDKRMLGEVIAIKGYNYLVRVRTVDMERYAEETEGSENGAYFEFDGIGRASSEFIDLDSEIYRKEGFPLKDKYYFIVKGRPVVASESYVRREINTWSMDRFKTLMNDRWWSWRDEESLIMLLELLPK